MATLTDVQLGLIRDEIGSTTPPTDDDLTDLHTELDGGPWQAVALRVLRRRAAEMSRSDVKSVTLAGVITVSLNSSLKDLNERITRLEQALEQIAVEQAQPAATGRLRRFADYR